MASPIQIPIQITADAKGAQQAAQALQQVSQAEVQAAQASTKLVQAQNQAAISAQKLAQAENQTAIGAQKVATAEQQAAQAVQKTAQATASAEAAQSRAAQAALRLQQAQEKAAGSSEKAASAFSGLKDALGAAGIAVGVRELVEFGQGAIELANRTDNAERALRALAGSTSLYDQAMQAAHDQQILFGGSLEENIQGIQGLVTISRQSNVELSKLIDLSQRLAIKAPEQGAAGARIAIQEGLTGQTTSLQRRFNIPAEDLAKLRDNSTSAAEKVKLLSDYLDKIGISSATVTGAVNDDTKAFNDLQGSIERATIAFGTFLSKQTSGIAQGLAGGLDRFTQGSANGGGTAGGIKNLLPDLDEIQIKARVAQKAINDLHNAGGGNHLVDAGLPEAIAALQAVGDKSRVAAAAQEYYATTTKKASATSIAGGEAARQVAAAYEQLRQTGSGSADALAALVPRLQAVAATSTENAHAVELLVQGYVQGTVTAEELRNALAGLEAQHQGVTGATQENAIENIRLARANQQQTDTSTASGKAIAEEAAAKQQSALATQDLNDLQAALAQIGPQVAGGLVSSANAAQVLAIHFGIATDEALKLVQAQALLAAGSGAARIAAQEQATLHAHANYGTTTLNAPGRQGNGDASIADVVRQQQATKDAAKAQEDYTLSLGKTSAQRQVLTNRYNEAVAAEGADSAAAIKAKQALDEFNRSQLKAARGAKSRIDAAQNSANKIVQIEQDAANKLAAIDQREAEARAQAYRDLAADIKQTAADMVASQEADDLDLIGASADQAKQLAAREKAEANARIAEQKAVSEARERSANGDAATAQKVYDERQKQIQQQQALDEKYYQKQAELAGNNDAEAQLKQQYDEATKAIADATDVRIQLAQDEAAQKAAAVTAEKQAVLDSAAAQVEALGKTKHTAEVALGSVQDLNSGLAALPKNVETTVVVNYQTKGTPPKEEGSSAPAPSGSSGGSAAKAAGGGAFMTHGPTSFTVGDNPGGMELVSVVPISGKGTSSASGNVVKMAGGGQALVDQADRKSVV